MRVGSASARRIGASIRPSLRLDAAPHQRLVPPLARCAEASCATSDSRAAAVRATTSSPDVPLSRRWTIPGRFSAPSPARRRQLGEPGQQAVDQRALCLAGAGVHDQAGRLVDDDHRGVGVDD